MSSLEDIRKYDNETLELAVHECIGFLDKMRLGNAANLLQALFERLQSALSRVEELEVWLDKKKLRAVPVESALRVDGDIDELESKLASNMGFPRSIAKPEGEGGNDEA